MWKKRFDTRANKAHRKTELRLWSLVPGRFRNVGLGRPRPTRQHEVPGESYDTPRARIREAFRKEQRRFYFPCASAISATEKETHAPLLEQKSGVESNPSKWAWRTRAAAMASEDVLECRARRWMVVHCSHAAARCARPARLESGQPLRARAGLANDIGTRLEPPPFHLPPSFSFFLRWGGREEEEGGRGGRKRRRKLRIRAAGGRSRTPYTAAAYAYAYTHTYIYIYICMRTMGESGHGCPRGTLRLRITSSARPPLTSLLPSRQSEAPRDFSRKIPRNSRFPVEALAFRTGFPTSEPQRGRPVRTALKMEAAERRV